MPKDLSIAPCYDSSHLTFGVHGGLVGTWTGAGGTSIKLFYSQPIAPWMEQNANTI